MISASIFEVMAAQGRGSAGTKSMIKKISGGVIETEIFTTEDGYVAIRQPSPDAAAEQVCMISADQLPHLIRELQALYDDRQRWREPPVQ